MTVAWLGHATVLMNFYGTWILADPVLSERAGVRILGVTTFGVRRLVAPALSAKELPDVDALLLSHSHFDHTDLPTLKRLPKSVRAVVQKGNGDLVRRFKCVDELAWNESTEVKGARITAIPSEHWGARILTDRERGYGGFVIEKNNVSIVFAGDTAYTRVYENLRARFAPVALAIMPIGAYDPYIAAHANPEQAWRMAKDLRAESVLPVHHSTFRLSREPVNEPIERFLRAAGKESYRVAATRIGETWTRGSLKPEVWSFDSDEKPSKPGAPDIRRLTPDMA